MHRIKVFRLFFLKNNENYDVEVEEVKEIDFTKITDRLERGESVFISPKRKQGSSRKIPVKKGFISSKFIIRQGEYLFIVKI